MPVGMLFIMETLEDEWYIIIKDNKFTVFEILSVLSYIVCLRYPYI